MCMTTTMRRIGIHFGNGRRYGRGLIGVGLAGAELPLLEDCPSGALCLRRRRVDVVGVDELEPEMGDAPARARPLTVLFEDQHVSATGSLRLNPASFPINGHHAEHLLIELERPLGVSDGQSQMREPVSVYHPLLLKAGVAEARAPVQTVRRPDGVPSQKVAVAPSGAETPAQSAPTRA